eukprot:scaffold482212_cov45-Prasinocladus_malaysianus.AAC.1
MDYEFLTSGWSLETAQYQWLVGGIGPYEMYTTAPVEVMHSSTYILSGITIAVAVLYVIAQVSKAHNQLLLSSVTAEKEAPCAAL